MENEENKIHWLTEGVVISAIPLLGYAITFTYEMGYASYFSIPVKLINIDIPSVILSTFYVVLTLIILFIIGRSYLTLLNRENIIHRSLFKLFPVMMAFITLLIIYNRNWEKWIGISVMLVIYILLEFAFPLLTQRKIQGYKNKLTEQEKLEENFNKKSKQAISRYIIDKIGLSSLGIIVVIFFAIFISFASGENHAIKKEDFLIINNGNSELSVLQIYGDKLIASPLNKGNKEVEKSFYIYEVNEVSNVELKLEKVGPLIIKK